MFEEVCIFLVFLLSTAWHETKAGKERKQNKKY